MKFLDLSIAIVSLVGFTIGHPLLDERKEVSNYHPIEARTDAVSIPAGKDGNALHLWLRLDTTDAVYDNRAGIDHSNLNQVIKDMGGQHTDVIVGTKSSKREYGLLFSDKSWLKMPNGDGATIEPYGLNYKKLEGQRVTYVGQLAAGTTQADAQAQCKFSPHRNIVCNCFTDHDAVAAIMSGKKYNHSTFNCKTVADQMATWARAHAAA